MTVRGTIDSAVLLYNRGSWRDAATLIENINGATQIEAYEMFALIGWIDWKIGGINKSTAVLMWNDVIKNGEEIADQTTLATAHAGLGIYYAENGNKDEALQHAQLAQDLLPENAISYQNRNLNSCGITMAKIGELSRAEEILKKVAKINEQLMKSNDQEIAREATHQRGKNGYNLATLVYIPQKMWNEAIEELQNVVILRYIEVGAETDLAAAYHRIAECYENLSDFENALIFEEKSLEFWKKHSDDPQRVKTAEKNIRHLKQMMV